VTWLLCGVDERVLRWKQALGESIFLLVVEITQQQVPSRLYRNDSK